MTGFAMDLVGRLVGWLFVQGPLLLLVAAVTAWVLRDVSASTRHRVWSAAVVAVLVLPVLTLALPRFGVMPSLTERLESFGLHAERPHVSPVVQVAPVAMPSVVVLPGGTGRGSRAPIVVSVAPTQARQVAVLPPVALNTSGSMRAGLASFDRTPAPFGAAGFPALPIEALALLVWAAVAAGLMMRLAVCAVRTRAQESRLSGAPPELARTVDGIARDRGVWNLRVLIGAWDAMPSTWGTRRPVLLLPLSAATWSDARMEAVVRHELAHIRRADTRFQLCADLVCALHWFNPLAWYAAHRMRVERELACDDEVLATGTCAFDYAGQLVALARALRPAPLGVAMAGSGGLRTRIDSLLDAQRPRGTAPGVSTGIRLIAALCAVGVAMLAPRASAAEPDALVWDVPAPDLAFEPHVIVTEPAWDVAMSHVVPSVGRVRDVHVARIAAPDLQDATLCWTALRGGSTSTRTNNDEFRLDWDRDDCSVDVQIDGEPTFNAEFTSIAGLSAGGRARFEERDGRRSRRVELRPTSGGLERRWLVDGDETPWDADADRWLQAMVLNTFRSGAFATERAEWLVRERGIDALLQELPLLRGDWARGQYYRAGLAVDLTDAQVVRLTRQAGREIGSDHTLMTVLESVAEHHSLTSPTIRAAYIEAAGSIGSDHAKGRVMSAALMQPDLPTDDIAAILDAVSDIGSDHEKMTLLVAMAERHTLTPELRASYLRAASSIGSDHAKARTAEALFRKRSPSPAETAIALEMARGIGSDHELSNLLIALPVDLRNDSHRRDFEAAVSEIGSDHSLGQVLQSLLKDGRVDAVTAGVILRASEGIGSDHELGEVLKGLVRAGGVTPDNRAAFDRAAARIDSRHTREQVDAALRTAR